MFSLIFAISQNGVIGNKQTQNGLPWHYSEDLAFYKNKTQGKINIMGRKTYEMIGHALPNRDTIVLTTNQDLRLSDATIINDYQTLLYKYLNTKEEVMVCGGQAIFELFINYADKIYLTLIKKDYSGDKFYHPNLEDFTIINKVNGQNKDLIFYTLQRKDLKNKVNK